MSQLEKDLQAHAKAQVAERFKPHLDGISMKLPESKHAYKARHLLRELQKEIDGMAIAMAAEVAS